MALNDANIRAVITAEDKASAVLDNFGNNVNSTAGKIGNTLKVVAEGLVAATAAVTGFATLSLKAYSGHEEAIAQINQVLQTTGKNATISASGVEQIAKSMENYSGKSQQAVLQGQTLLLQFSQVTNKNLPEFTKAMLDLSQRMGVDTVTAAKQLGIALDDPATGMTRLRRSGIDFTEAQKEAIKQMQKSGDLAGADALLMKSLEARVGGAAGAYRNTLGGALASAKNSLHDFEIEVGQAIAKYLEPLAKKAADALAAIDWNNVINDTISVLKVYGTYLGNLWRLYDQIYQQIEHYLEPKLEALWKSIEAAFPVFRKFIDEYINPLVEFLAVTAGKSLVWALGFVIDTLNLLLKVATPVFQFLDDHKDVVFALAGAFGALAVKMALGAAFDAVNVGFATMQLVTIPALTAELSVLGSAFVAAMPYAAVGAFVVWFASKMDQIKNAYDNMYSHISGVSADAQRIQTQAIADFKAGKISKDQEVKILQIAAAEADSVVHHAAGGTYTAGQPMVVGEQGPELMVPGSSGTIIPNNKLGGNTTVNITIQAKQFTGTQIEARQHAMDVFKALQDYAASKNTTLSSMVAKS